MSTRAASKALQRDSRLRDRARRVIPGGMYGHQSTKLLPPRFPQFIERGDGCRVWDVDGNEYIDLVNAYGPVVLGHRHPRVEEAAARQRELADCQNTPTARIVELAELFVEIVPHADWAMFQKNGTDATTLCLTIARAATGRRKVLVATDAYHGAAPWCTPGLEGVLPEDRAHLVYYRYNDAGSVESALDKAGDDLAAILVSPFRHDLGRDQELVLPEFAQQLRDACDVTGAALILDDVRCGLRLDVRGSWEALGVRPDLSAWSKAIANGYPLAAVLGGDSLREAASDVFTTGSFWFAGVAMAASIATIQTIVSEDGIDAMRRTGQQLRDGLAEQASAHGLGIRQTGPVQMPFLTFDRDVDFAMANLWTECAAAGGVYLHPQHNWFMSAAHEEQDVAEVLDVTDKAFSQVKLQFGAG